MPHSGEDPYHGDRSAVEVWSEQLRRPSPRRGDIDPVDVILPGGDVLTATYAATVEWARGMGALVLDGSPVVPPVEGETQ